MGRFCASRDEAACVRSPRTCDRAGAAGPAAVPTRPSFPTCRAEQPLPAALVALSRGAAPEVCVSRCVPPRSPARTVSANTNYRYVFRCPHRTQRGRCPARHQAPGLPADPSGERPLRRGPLPAARCAAALGPAGFGARDGVKPRFPPAGQGTEPRTASGRRRPQPGAPTPAAVQEPPPAARLAPSAFAVAFRPLSGDGRLRAGRLGDLAYPFHI